MAGLEAEERDRFGCRHDGALGRAAGTVEAARDIDGENGLRLRLVDLAEVESNGWDLNIGRYIQTEATAEVDVEAALAAYWESRDAQRAAERVLDEKLKAAGFGA